MVFERLESRLDDAHVSTYLDIIEDVREPTRTVFNYLLDIITSIESVDLQNEYTIFGGYAVLTHLMDHYGDKIIKMWRGSSDIDIAASISVLNLLHAFYHVNSDKSSPNIQDKRTVKLQLPKEDLCKIDFTLDNEQKRYDREVKAMLGIPINVGTPYSLIKSKLRIAQAENNHRVDIMNLLRIIEDRQDNTDSIVRYLEPTERKMLKDVINRMGRRLPNERMVMEPSDRYLSQIKSRLEKAYM